VLGRDEDATVDLYFAVEGPSEQLLHPELTWTVITSDGAHTERTPVEVDRLDPAASARHAGWGREWWFDPAHDWPRPPVRALVTSNS
jgi:hypothetical protein